jgi:cell volume regulation protein A
MPQAEPQATALLLAGFGGLMAASILGSRALGRLGLPVFVLFLLAGVAAGSPWLGHFRFHDTALAYRLGTLALVLILFDGGLNTPLSTVRAAIKPALALATFGVLGTAALMGVAAHALGFSWSQGLLLGAIVSSTDAAAVFSVLRGSGLHLKKRVGLTLELESGLNDPMAVLLTQALTVHLVTRPPLGWNLLAEAGLQLGVGAAVGLAAGKGGQALLRRVTLPASGLYPVFSLALACVAYGAATLLHGSGFLSVFVAGVLLGSKVIRNQIAVRRVHDGLAWLAQVSMFLMLGILDEPAQLLHAAPWGLGLGLFLALVARPVPALLSLLPFGFKPREALYVAWVGLRGAVPIVLALGPMLVGAPGSERIFDVVFFVVGVSAVVPGGTVAWATRKLKLERAAPPPPPASVEISTSLLATEQVHAFHVDAASAVAGAALEDLPLPGDSSTVLVVRRNRLLPAQASTLLEPGDYVYVFCREEDFPFVQLLFGQAEEE